MSQENVEAIRGMDERWLRDDASLFDALDPKIELRPDPAADWVGVNDIPRGHDGVRSYMAQVYEAFKAIRLDLYLDRDEALEAVGLRE